MKPDPVIQALAKQFGIAPNFRDLSGTEKPTSVETTLALLRANGVDVSSQSAMQETLEANRQKAKEQLCADELIFEAGSDVSIPIAKPAQWILTFDNTVSEIVSFSGKANNNIALSDLPIGVHTLTLHRKSMAQEVMIIVAPPRCPSVRDLIGRSKIWGVNTALYGLHSKDTCGMGTYRDLGLAAETVGGLGASFLGINPVHSIGWADDVTISPYSPSHRGFLNTDHIDLSEFHEPSSDAVPRKATLNHVWHQDDQKRRLHTAYDYFQRNASRDQQHAFAQYQEDEGEALEDYVLFETLSEFHGPDWQRWPEEFQTCGNRACVQFARAHQSRTNFHAWAQWLADQQLDEAQSQARASGMRLGLYLDLAVGPRRGAAETWCERSCIAQGVSIGAPPDHLSPAGQNWDLAAYAPDQQKRTGYRSFRSLLARSLRHAGVLRIDHALGLKRSYWIPDDGAPGGYVNQPCNALLAIVAIEASKSGSIIIGEDLGLVPSGFRDQLHSRGLYSYAVLQYEKNEDGAFTEPEELPEQSLICFSTHDTPTLHGYLQQKDIDWWRKLDWIDGDKEIELRTSRASEVEALAKMAGIEKSTNGTWNIDALSIAIHAILAQSPVAMVSVQLDDAIGEVEAQNLPGTINEHPNWQRRSSLPIEDFSTNVALVTIAKQMNRAKR